MKNDGDKNLSQEEILLLLKEKVKILQQNKLKSKIPIKKVELNKTSKTIKENKYYRFMKKGGDTLASIGLYSFALKLKTKFRIFPEYVVYILTDFTQYHDEEFIYNAYNKILNRDPKKEEKEFYHNQLRVAQLSKIEIISALYFSKEGRTNNIKILGMKKRYLALMLFSIPLIGNFFETLYYLIRLSKTMKRITLLENNLILDTVDKNTFIKMQEDIENKIQNKVDENTFIKMQEDIENKLNTNEDIPESLELVADDFVTHAFDSISEDLSRYKKTNEKALYYTLFEQAFYNHDIIIEKQKVYLPYLVKSKNKNLLHLDVGCGRGEFLSILKKYDIKSIGIDINPIEIQILSRKQYEVTCQDVLSYLELSKNTFTSISALQVIEHLSYDYLKKFIQQAYTKLQKDGIIILETICPYNPVTLNSFYMDETHIKLIPPELITFILQWYGFQDIKILFTSPLPKELRVKNINMRNYHDYAVIGYKK